MRRALAILGGILLAVVFSQFPEYAQQYAQRLGGAVDELRLITLRFDAAATQEGLTRQVALERYKAVPDTFVAGQGRDMEATFARFDELTLRLAEVQGAGPIERLTDLPVYLDTEIGAATLANFKPAVPVTIEGFAWAAAGFLLGALLTGSLGALLGRPFRRRYPLDRRRI